MRSPWSPLAGAWRDLTNMTTALVAIVAPQSVIRGRVTEVELLSHKQFDETI